MAGLARDAAKAGEVEIVKNALGQIGDNEMRDQAALEAARLLAKRNLRKYGVEVAKSITSNEIRDQALSELAR